MKNNLPPLYYAIIGQFKDDAEHCAADIVTALESDYAGYKLLTNKDVEEALQPRKRTAFSTKRVPTSTTTANCASSTA